MKKKSSIIPLHRDNPLLFLVCIYFFSVFICFFYAIIKQRSFSTHKFATCFFFLTWNSQINFFPLIHISAYSDPTFYHSSESDVQNKQFLSSSFSKTQSAWSNMTATSHIWLLELKEIQFLCHHSHLPSAQKPLVASGDYVELHRSRTFLSLQKLHLDSAVSAAFDKGVYSFFLKKISPPGFYKNTLSCFSSLLLSILYLLCWILLFSS